MFIFGYSFTYYTLLSQIWIAAHPFPPLDTFTAICAVFFLHGAGYLYLRPSFSQSLDTKRPPRLSSWLRWGTFLSLGAFLTFTISHTQNTDYHPINNLISNAKYEHQQWVSKAGKSTNLGEAVVEYRRRYHQLPPPYVFTVHTPMIICLTTSQWFRHLV